MNYTVIFTKKHQLKEISGKFQFIRPFLVSIIAKKRNFFPASLMPLKSAEIWSQRSSKIHFQTEGGSQSHCSQISSNLIFYSKFSDDLYGGFKNNIFL